MMYQMKASADILTRYHKLALHDANEAETRLKVIDQILFDVLGWSHDGVTVEERVSEDGKTTFADYVLSRALTKPGFSRAAVARS